MPLPLDKWLETLMQNAGSDILLVSDAPVCMLIEGEVRGMETPPLTGAEIESAVLPALTPHALELYRRDGIADSSYRVQGLGRFRINLHHQRGEAAAAIRALPSRVPQLADLNLPPQVHALSQLKRGLVLIGGPAGSGKTTTVAALINEINRASARHIVIIEDPIEYEHTHEHSIIEQVEIGSDAPDFPTALRAALRQAPEIIVVGEMRDPETMRIAVSAAETGHLVLSTLHTTDIASTIGRVSDSFPAERQNTIRQDLAMAHDPDAYPQQQRETRSRGRAAHAWLRNSPSHPPQRLAALAPGDHADQEHGIANAGGIARAPGHGAQDRPRRSHDARRSPGRSREHPEEPARCIA
jgi:twitching motility protein PilT